MTTVILNTETYQVALHMWVWKYIAYSAFFYTSHFPADLVTFTEEIFNGKLHFLYIVKCWSDSLLILQRDEFYWHPESKLVFLCNTEKKSVTPFCNVCIFEKTCYLSWTLTLFDISSYDNLYYLGQGQICPLVISMPIAWNLAHVSPTQKTFKKKIKWYHYPISN